MTAKTDYIMTPEQASDIAGLAQMDSIVRASVLRAYAEVHGQEDFIRLFAQFISMANSVVANCREMSDQVLIEECGVHPDKFDSVNLPTIIGACHGVMIASRIDDQDGLCHGCAYRLGSIANQSPITTDDADFMAHDARGFMCHAETDEHGEPTKVCVGHAKAAKGATQAEDAIFDSFGGGNGNKARRRAESLGLSID
jgi:hypothetical protein